MEELLLNQNARHTSAIISIYLFIFFHVKVIP